MTPKSSHPQTCSEWASEELPLEYSFGVESGSLFNDATAGCEPDAQRMILIHRLGVQPSGFVSSQVLSLSHRYLSFELRHRSRPWGVCLLWNHPLCDEVGLVLGVSLDAEFLFIDATTN